METTINVEGDLHVYLPDHGDPAGQNRVLNQILQAVNELETKMSELSDAVTAAAGRVDQDFANMRSLLDQANAIATQALATDVADQATIADLTAQLAALTTQAAALTADASAAVTGLNAMDPDPSNPTVPVDGGVVG